MPNAEIETHQINAQLEAERIAALEATGILDSEPEACYDAITRLDQVPCGARGARASKKKLPLRNGAGSRRSGGNLRHFAES